MANSLKNLVGLVTGGASGMGRAMVSRWVEQGGRVVFCDVSQDLGKQVENELGGDCVFVQADVTSESDIKRVMETVKDKFGRLDVLVNNAGVVAMQPIYRPDTDTVHSLEEFTRVVNVNLIGNFNVARLAVQLISKNEPDADGQRGVIVHNASQAIFESMAGTCAYAASKGGVGSMTLPMARELGPLGIRVVTVATGIVDTAMSAPMPQEHRTAYCSTIPFPQRFGKPEEFAHLVQSIIDNQFLNGCIIRMDGGQRK